MKKALKYFGVGVLGFTLLMVLIVTLFVNLSPEFGKGPTKEQKVAYAKTSHFQDGVFINEIPSEMDIQVGRLLKKAFAEAPNRNPSRNIEVEKIDSIEIVTLESNISRLTWFGHSAFLLEIEGKKILLDPMFGQVPAPHPWLGPKRYSRELPIDIEQLPYIDAIILSHDHYDHLDYGSIQKLKEKVGAYYAPLGVGNHLSSWGIPDSIIHELDWWDSMMLDNIKLVSTPARHFSGRGLFDRATTLWSSWVVSTDSINVYFSGDGGYGPHFKEIGEKYGPFDIALMECGQYNIDWKAIHMLPEETVQASVDLDANYFMPIHWAGFTLAFHDWDDPVVRATKKAEELNIPILTPKIGQQVYLEKIDSTPTKWWEAY